MGRPNPMLDNRAPCPDRILEDIGGAFAMGTVGSAAFHFFEGLRSSPSGERFIGGVNTVRMNAPRIGGSFGAWGGLFSAFDCSLVFLRRKEDPWNSIVAAAATGGLLNMRQGLRVAGRSALFGGALLALFEGYGIMLKKAAMAAQQQPKPPQETGSSSSWFGGLFGGEKNSGGGAMTEILESFDTPTPPTFEF